MNNYGYLILAHTRLYILNLPVFVYSQLFLKGKQCCFTFSFRYTWVHFHSWNKIFDQYDQ